MKDQLFEDRVRGVIFGHAIGDALGLGTEFLSKRQVEANYPHGLQRLEQIIRDAHRSRWPSGAWTDDTDQMLCILDSLLEKGAVDVPDIAYRIYQWAAGGGMGIGRTVANVVYAKDFLADPHLAAERVWKMSSCLAAANGGVMRTSILGVWQHNSPATVSQNAEAVCKITHYDPRCVASCVCICRAISALLNGISDMVVLAAFLEAESAAIDPRVSEYFEKARQPEIADLSLDDRDSIGYTFKAMGAGIWSLLHPSCFREGIIAVIHEGGDADTNAAVAGGVLGARFGFADIPEEWIDGLLHKQELEERIQKLLEILQPDGLLLNPSG